MVSKNIRKVVTFKTSDKGEFRTKDAAKKHIVVANKKAVVKKK
jgi:hypothetical protein